MTVYDYIDNYGIYDFNEKEFTEVDSMIFAFLSYADYSNIFDNKKKLTISEIGRMHLGLHKEKDKNIMAVREANKLLRYIKDVKRYKDCLISNYEYLGNKDVQFGAMTIEYKKNCIYVSFEGTDQLFSGWKENFLLSYEFPTLSHKMAIKYLNRHFTFSSKKLIIGGHSKGGNLALVAAMYANMFVRRKITYIYSGDGPGVLDRQYNSKRYEEIRGKFSHIIPDYSFVGLLLNTSNNKVVKCKYKNVISHNAMYWEVEDDHFLETDLSPMSKDIERQVKDWFYRYNDEDKKEFVSNLMKVLDEAQVESILDLGIKKTKVLEIIYDTKDISDNSRVILTDFINVLVKSVANTKTEEFKNFVSNIFKIKE